jgi:trigger factor
VSEQIEPRIEDVNAVKKRIFFDVPWQDVQNELDAAYRKVGKTAKIKGFRPGKIPRNILEKYYRQNIEDETVSSLVNRHYWETIQKNKIPVVSQPVIEQKGIESKKDFTFTATVEIEPEIEPVGYTGLQLEKPVPVVTDAEVEANLEQMRQMFAVLEDVVEDRGIEIGDFVTITFEAILEGKKLPELKAENYLLAVGERKFIPGFEEQLFGLKKGEKHSITVHFPDNYQLAQVASKDVEFAVEIKDVRIKKLPAIDEQFLKNFDKYQSIEELRADVKRGIVKEKEKRFQTAFQRDISNKLIENNPFEAPDVFIEQQIYYMVNDAQSRMISEGLEPEKAEELAMSLKDHFREEATKIVKASILLDRIARKEAIAVRDDEVDNRIREFAAQRAQNYQTLKESFEKDGLIENVRTEIVNLKTYKFIEANANLTFRELEQLEIGGAEK